MDSFQQYRMIVFLQIGQQAFVAAAVDNVGKLQRKASDVFFACIVIDRSAIGVQFFLRRPALRIAMQVYADALFMQCFEFTEEINHASIIGRPGNIMGYYMEVFFRQFNWL